MPHIPNLPLGVTVLISTYNGAHRLAPTLEALAHQNLDGIPEAELLIVDNASTDNTKQTALDLWQKLGEPYPLTVLNEPKPGKLNAQETGFKHARYAFIITCDDDNAFVSDYLQLGYQCLLQNPKVGVLGGQGFPKTTVPLPKWFDTYAYRFACGPQAPSSGNVNPTRNVVYGAGMWVRMKAYHQMKGLDYRFLITSRTGKKLKGGGEDGELCWAIRFLGYQVWYLEEMKFDHYIPAERLNDEHLKRLLVGQGANGPLNNLHYRIAYGDLKTVPSFFWLREWLYNLRDFFRLHTITDKKIRSNEKQRLLVNLSFILQARSTYDKQAKQVLEYYKRCESLRSSLS